MLDRKPYLLLFAVVLCLSSACSVKENRGPCPCWLTVDYSGFWHVADSVTVFAWDADGVSYSEVSHFQGDSLGMCVHKVDKGPVISTVLGGLRNGICLENRLIIPTGCQFDRLYAFSERVDCPSEESVSIAKPQKHHVRLQLKVEGGAENSPYHFKLSSDVAGISMLNLMPIAGEFQYLLFPTTDERCYIDIPRQFPDSDALVLEAIRDGQVKVRLNLARALREEGYNWQATNLADIPIEFGFSEAEVGFKVNAWNQGDNLDIIY